MKAFIFSLVVGNTFFSPSSLAFSGIETANIRCLNESIRIINDGSAKKYLFTLAQGNQVVADWLFLKTLRDTERVCNQVGRMVAKGLSYEAALQLGGLQWLAEVAEEWKANRNGYIAPNTSHVIPNFQHVIIQESLTSVLKSRRDAAFRAGYCGFMTSIC